MMIYRDIRRILKMVFALSLVMLLAVHCPDPLPDNTDAIIETEYLKEFKKVDNFVISVMGEERVAYNEEEYQLAKSSNGKMFRFQRDDETAFLNLIKSGSKAEEATFIITYKQENDNTIHSLSVDMRLVQKSEQYQWWWNDAINTGVIISK